MSSSDDQFFVCGGAILWPDYSNSCEKLSVEDNSWETVNDVMPFGMRSAVAVAHGSFLYVIGGQFVNRTTDPTVYLNTVLRYDTVEGGPWRLMAPMKEKRSGAAGVLLRSSDGSADILICGGHRIGIPYYSCEVYATETDRWSVFPSLTQARMFHSMVEWKGRLFIIGGARQILRGTATIEEFRSDIGQWTEGDVMLPKWRHSVAAVVY